MSQHEYNVRADNEETFVGYADRSVLLVRFLYSNLILHYTGIEIDQRFFKFI